MKNYKQIVYPLLATLAVAPMFVTTPLTANAKKVSHVRYARRAHRASHNTSKNRAWATRLDREGYVFRLSQNGMYSEAMSKAPGKPSWISGKTVKKWARAKVNFKVANVWTDENGTEYNLVSQNGKDHGWISFNGGSKDDSIYNKESYRKALKPLVKSEARVVNNIGRRNSKKVINNGIKTSSRLAHKLSGHNRVIALRSMNQLRAYAKHDTFSNLPALVIGQL